MKCVIPKMQGYFSSKEKPERKEKNNYVYIEEKLLKKKKHLILNSNLGH